MISVCMPTCNGEKFIQQQLDSILSQLGSDDELIISDDSSTDRTIALIKAFNDPRIMLLENCTFKNPIFNIENALKVATGQFIFLADQDDIWFPEKIKKTVELLFKFDMVVCNGIIIDQDAQTIHPSYFDWRGSGKGFFKNLAKNSYMGCSMAFNRKILAKALPFPEHISMHDLWLGLIAECEGQVFFLNEPLFSYRRHADNYTAAISKADNALSDFSLFYKIRYRVVMLAYVLKRVLLNR